MKIEKESYQILLTEIKDSIQHAQVRAGQYVNRTMIELYWHIGKTITERQETEGWGKSVVERLSQDLKTEFPNTEGFSVQNLWYMRQLYLTYRNFPILQQLAGEIPWMRQVLGLFLVLKKMIWK